MSMQASQSPDILPFSTLDPSLYSLWYSQDSPWMRYGASEKKCFTLTLFVSMLGATCRQCTSLHIHIGAETTNCIFVAERRLYGITALQSYNYFRDFPKDRLLLRGMVRYSLSRTVLVPVTLTMPFRFQVTALLCVRVSFKRAWYKVNWQIIQFPVADC